MATTNSQTSTNFSLPQELVNLLQDTDFTSALDSSNLDSQEILELFSTAFNNAGVNNPFSTGSINIDDLLYSENPFASENFWNIFANGQNPTQLDWNQVLSNFLTGENPFTGLSGNPFSNGDSNNLFEFFGSDTSSQQSTLDVLREILGDNITLSGSNNSTVTNQIYNDNNATIGNSNKNYGSDNATIGNSNTNYGTNSATIGNSNSNFDNNNTTIGNNNWLYASDNTTLGNDNWYGEEGSNNSIIGNNNWSFGSNNLTIGNGNLDFGSNNTIIGNGNIVFTSGNTIVGNGSLVVDSDNTSIGINSNISNLESLTQGIKTDVDGLVNSLIGRIGDEFLTLTETFGVSNSEIFNRLILSRDGDSNEGSIDTDIQQFLASLSYFSENAIAYPPVYSPQPVPEPTFSIPLVVTGFVCLLLSKFKKRIA